MEPLLQNSIGLAKHSSFNITVISKIEIDAIHRCKLGKLYTLVFTCFFHTTLRVNVEVLQFWLLPGPKLPIKMIVLNRSVFERNIQVALLTDDYIHFFDVYWAQPTMTKMIIDPVIFEKTPSL